MRPFSRGMLAWPGVMLAASQARADPQGLSTYVPVQVEDALVIRFGEFELQGVGRFNKDTHSGSGHDLWILTPEVKYGATKRLELIVGPTYSTGNQGGANQGGGSFTALYQFNGNSTYVPAFAVQAGYTTPFGAGEKSAQIALEAIATKYFGPSDTSPRLHLNLFWTHRTTPGATTRDDQLAIGVAYSMLVRSDTAMVIDFVHGALSSKGKDENIVDAGFRHEIGSSWAVSVGAGAGIAANSPNYRFIFALQKAFQLF